MKVVRLPALRTGRLYPPGNIPDTHFCLRLSQPQGHSVAGRIMSLNNSSDAIGNRTRNLPTCSAVPQPTAPPRSATQCNTLVLITYEYRVKQSLYRPGQAQRVEAPRYEDNQHMKVVRLSPLRIGSLYPPGNIPGTHFC